MEPLEIRQFFPNCEITIFTTDGKTIASSELLGSATTLQVIRSVDGSAGQFILDLTAYKDKDGHSWQDRIHPMDYVVIKLGNKNDLHVRMRGFVDSVAETLTMGATGGPQRAVIITGRDYTKLPVELNIQYLWQDMITGADGSVPGLFYNYGIPIADNDSLQKITSLLMNSIFNGTTGSNYAFIPNYKKVSKISVPNLELKIDVPEKFSVFSGTIQPYTGAFWNLLTYYASPPLGEIFITDTDDGPILVLRVNPFKDSSGNYVSPASASFLPDIKVDPGIVISYNLGKSDEQVLNYFFAYSDISGNGAAAAPMYATPGIIDSALTENLYSQNSPASNPAWISKSVDLYGFRPLNIVTPWLNYADISQTSQSVQLATELSTFCASVYGHNQDLISGTMITHGDYNFIPGRYINFSTTSLYLERVSETFNFIGSPSPTWTAILTVTRGRTI